MEAGTNTAQENQQSDIPELPSYKPQPAPIVKILLFLVIALLLGAGGGFAWTYFGQQKTGVLPEKKSPEPLVIAKPGEQFTTPEKIPLAHTAFGLDILGSLAKGEDSGKNIFISPSSIALAFSMVYNGAASQTKKAIATTMHISNLDIQELNKASASLINKLQNPDPDIELSLANSIWAREGFSFTPDFLATNKQYYQAQIESLDFSKEDAADIINKWVSANTKDKIKTIVDKPISPDTVMYLINALYFKGSWTIEFDEKLTANREFALVNGSKLQQPFMKQKRDDFMYLENDNFQAVKLPYGKNKSLNMYVFLPKSGLENFLKTLTVDSWAGWLKDFNEMEGTLLLPKFKIEYDQKLSGTLKALGMNIAFSPEADFSLARPEKDIFISEVKHKTFIDVNEKGTEAAAATSIEMRATAVMNPSPKKTFYMEVNRPFFFSIVDNESQEILFMGIINEPKI